MLGMWKTAVLATLLSLAASPALASDATSVARGAKADPYAGTTALDEAPYSISQLTERVEELESRVDQLGVATRPPAPTAADLKRAQREREEHAEFVNQVWTMP